MGGGKNMFSDLPLLGKKEIMVIQWSLFHLSVMNTHGKYLFSQDVMSYILAS